MEIRLLGTVEVWAGGRRLEVGPPQRRAALAALAVDAGRPVLTETLVDRIWGEAPPARSRAAIHANITLLRRLLQQANAVGTGQPSELVHRGDGYVLRVDPQEIDLLRLRGLVAAAAESTDAERAGLLEDALDLWRGPALADVPGAWPARMREGWVLERLDIAVDWARTRLRLGGHEQLIGRVRSLLTEYPLAEPLVAVLMRALSATGRTAETLECYTVIRQRLAEDLGVDPGPELQDLHKAILRGELQQPAPQAAARQRTVPAQLPVSVRGFTGRDDELAQLDKILAAAGQRASTMPVTTLAGMAGVGKTALAVCWAHRVADQFPDGQLYVNLRGFDPGGPVVEPAQAVRGFLDALGVPPERIPPTLDAQTALYRSLLAGRRVLVILDNARDAEQVRPLLPGTSAALVVVTSRHQLTPLVATEGAEPLTLDVLSNAEARELLGTRLGAVRVAAEPEAVDAIITACARLPLALAVAAARARQTRFPLATLAEELGGPGNRLDVLDAGDPASQVRAVFSWSYDALTRPAARLFRLLGLQPGADISVAAAASLAARPREETRRLLTELARANLLVEHVPGRYALHDLLRAYAAELARTHDPDDQRHAAITRLLDHYLHTAYAADRLLDPARDAITLTAPQPGVTAEGPADHQQALSWLTAEYPVLMAAIAHAATTGFDTHTCQLAWVLVTFLSRQGHWHDQAATGRAALAAARRLADPIAQALAHRQLAHAYTLLDRADDANSQLTRALDLCRCAGDRIGQARTHVRLGVLLERRGLLSPGLHHARQAFDLFQDAGHRHGQADALSNVGWYHALLGDYQEALSACQRALTLHRELDDRVGQAHTLDSLGYAYHHLGHHTKALTCYQQAFTLFRALDDRYYQANTLIHLGDARRAADDPRAARGAWRDALAILGELYHPDADRVRAQLR